MIERLSKDENEKIDGIIFSGGMETKQQKKKIWHLSHALLYIRLRGACRAYLFPGVDG